MQREGAMAYLDLLIAVLQEHEKKLSEIADRLEKVADRLEDPGTRTMLKYYDRR